MPDHKYSLNPLWIFLAGLAVFAPAPRARAAITSSTTAASVPAPLSAETRDFLKAPVDRSAFARGLSLVKNKKDSAQSRRLILDKLHGARKTMDSAQLRAFRDATAALAKDPQEAPGVSAQAIGDLASLNLLLLERGAITPAEAKQEAPFLLQAAQDPAKDRELRGRAIRALSDLKVAAAVPMLQQLLADPQNHNQPEVARNGCIALARLSPNQAQPAIVGVMSQTRDRSVFGSGAFALGQIKTPEALAALVKLRERFPDSDSVDAALAGMEEVVLKVLANPDDPQLIPAIHATQFLWKKEQREKVLPLLRGLLKTAPPAARDQALEQLLAAATALDFADENRELETILGLIADQPELARYADRIRQRLAAQPLTPTANTIPVPTEGGK